MRVWWSDRRDDGNIGEGAGDDEGDKSSRERRKKRKPRPDDE